MTIQEEILNGVVDYLQEHDGIICLRATECEDVDCEQCRAEGVVAYLHSKGVVIKVDEIKEVATDASHPETFSVVCKDSVFLSTEKTSYLFKAFKDANYVAVAPLIL